MDRDDVIRIAKEAGLQEHSGNTSGLWGGWIDDLLAFASLVAAHEREECAKACEEVGTYDYDDPSVTFVEAIRQRGSAD